MDTRVLTPQQVFNMPQRLLVPLFQRPYVWNEENQWAPLWTDVVRVADRRLTRPGSKQFPHFLGAVVLQQAGPDFASMQQWIVIDGQQRLTTLQLLLDALQIELEAVGAKQPARRIETLVANSDAYWSAPEDRFKVWPTNRDRPAFNEVMAAEGPIDYNGLQQRGERLVEGHRFFAEQARKWLLLNGAESVEERSNALEHTVRELLQVVVIELTVEENAQEIFETLNARGAQLTAADLIKNFVFQRLMEAGEDVESIYKRNWHDFETAFWEAEVGAGRVRYSRSSLFLNHWLISRTGEEIVAREVFTRFKQYADHEAGLPMARLVEEIAAASKIYRDFVESAAQTDGNISDLGLFAYRTGVLESEVIKPLVLLLLDPTLPVIPRDQVAKALRSLESWLVRRMLIRASTKSYTQAISELVTQVLKAERARAGDVVETFLKDQKVESRYWPDDNELRTEVRQLVAYRRLRRPRLRMILEAIEDHKRGWRDGKESLTGARVVRGKYAIEHVLPRQWEKNWPVNPNEADLDRERLLHTLGNLTLITGRLNSKVSNSGWSEKSTKLKEHDILMLNRDLLEDGNRGWSHEVIRSRTDLMVNSIIEIWPAPEGHVSAFARSEDRPKHKIVIADLIGAGLLNVGDVLYARERKFEGRTATILADGRIEVDGQAFFTPSGAAGHIVGRNRNGWMFFLVDLATRKKLNDLFYEYVDLTSADADESELDDDETDEEDEADEE